MSGDLRRKKKKSKWGADLDAAPGVSGISLDGNPPAASATPVEGPAAVYDPSLEDQKRINATADGNGAFGNAEGAVQASTDWRTEGNAKEQAHEGSRHDTGWSNASAGNTADADGTLPPKQSFTLSFARPTARARAPPPVAPPPQAVAPAAPAEPVEVEAGDQLQAPVQIRESDAAEQPTRDTLDHSIATLHLSDQPVSADGFHKQNLAEVQPEPQGAEAGGTEAPSLKHGHSSPMPPTAPVGALEGSQVIDGEGSAMDEDEEAPPGESPEREVEEQTEVPGQSQGPLLDAHKSESLDKPSPDQMATPTAQEEKATADSAAATLLPGQPLKEPCSLVVSNIRPTANEQSLRLLFESAGQVLGCKLVKDEASGAHKGFGFVMMASIGEAEAAAQKFNSFEWGDLRLQVSVKLPAKERIAAPVAASTGPQGTPTSFPGPPTLSSTAVPLDSAAQGSLPGPPPLQSSPADGAPGSSGPLSGTPSSLPIASAYGGYPPFDPYVGYFGYGYGYDPYAAYSTQPYAMPDGLPQPLPNTEDERPPGLDDDELPPGQDDEPAEAAAYQEHQEVGAPGETAPEEATEEQVEEVQAPPPPPVAPKKEPTVIHVPLKIPEGARKKQEERKKAREEKAKQLAEDENAEGTAVNGESNAAAAKPDQTTKPAPALLGTKGSFQEVLARRQAELAALKSKNSSKGAANAQPAGRPFRRGRSFSRSPPLRFRRSNSRSRSRPIRSPFRGPVRRPFGRPSSSPSYSRSPGRSSSPSYSRSPSPLGSRRGPSYSRSPSRYSYSGSDGWDRPLLSPGSAKRKEKLKSKEKKEKKRKQKKDKRRKSVPKDAVFDQPTPAYQPVAPLRESFLLPRNPLVEKPAPGWVEIDPKERKREIRLPSPPVKAEPEMPSEPAVFRQPARKRPRTRWHAEDKANDEVRDQEGDAEQPQALNGRREADANKGGRSSRVLDTGEIVQAVERKASPQVSEEGEIALEEGEIEGELLEVAESKPPPVQTDRRAQKNMGYAGFSYDNRYRYDRYRGDDRYREEEKYKEWDQPRFPGDRGRGVRESWGPGHDPRYANSQAW